MFLSWSIGKENSLVDVCFQDLSMGFFSIRHMGSPDGVCPTTPSSRCLQSGDTGPSIALSMATSHLSSFCDLLTLWYVSTSLVCGIGSTKVEKMGNLLTSPRQADRKAQLLESEISEEGCQG